MVVDLGRIRLGIIMVKTDHMKISTDNYFFFFWFFKIGLIKTFVVIPLDSG